MGLFPLSHSFLISIKPEDHGFMFPEKFAATLVLSSLGHFGEEILHVICLELLNNNRNEARNPCPCTVLLHHFFKDFNFHRLNSKVPLSWVFFSFFENKILKTNAPLPLKQGIYKVYPIDLYHVDWHAKNAALRSSLFLDFGTRTAPKLKSTSFCILYKPIKGFGIPSCQRCFYRAFSPTLKNSSLIS